MNGNVPFSIYALENCWAVCAPALVPMSTNAGADVHFYVAQISPLPHSCIRANVQRDPPVGTRPAAKRGITAPPKPDAIDTNWRPLCV
jgi:hypothetical protein